jgi:hypothetical protein
MAGLALPERVAFGAQEVAVKRGGVFVGPAGGVNPLAKLAFALVCTPECPQQRERYQRHSRSRWKTYLQS